MTWKQAIRREIKDNNYDIGYFTLQEFYRSSLNNLELKFNKNSLCKASIRDTLQRLRDDGYLEFVSPGKYRVISKENNEWIQFIKNYHKK
jgi:hypothetical protein